MHRVLVAQFQSIHACENWILDESPASYMGTPSLERSHSLSPISPYLIWVEVHAPAMHLAQMTADLTKTGSTMAGMTVRLIEMEPN
eukprot:scaffold133_cov67-Skeletonema_dohrnii-CCMP3373.AAC.1